MGNFSKGDIVFNEHGQRFVYVSEYDGDHIVKPTMETDEDEPWEGSPVTLRKVFSSAPREMYDKNIEALDAKIAKLEDQKHALDEEIRKSKFDETERKKRIKVNSSLKRIDDFLEGKVTHIVFGEYDVRIETFDEAIRYKENEYEKIPSKLRLLSLFGNSNGNLEWNLNTYSDGSGSRTKIWPCVSYEHALQVAQERINDLVSIWKEDHAQTYRAYSAVSAAAKLGLFVPEDVKAAVKNNIKTATELRDSKKEEYIRAENQLRDVLNKTAEEFAKGNK
jgi:hypothetical protein